MSRVVKREEGEGQADTKRALEIMLQGSQSIGRRRAVAVKAQAYLCQLNMASVAKYICKVSYNHLMLVLHGERKGSAELQQRIARFIGAPDVAIVFPPSEVPMEAPRVKKLDAHTLEAFARLVDETWDPPTNLLLAPKDSNGTRRKTR